MATLIEQLRDEAPVILDGAWGTELQPHTSGGRPSDELNLSSPEIVEKVARGYVEAGSRIILTNTFNGNKLRLQEVDLADKVFDINKAGAEISCRAMGGNGYVFGSIGPSGKMLMMGDVDEEELTEAFTEQARGLAEGGAHGLVIETMADLNEALCALKAAKTTGLPVIVCLIYDSGAEKDHTMMGNKADDAAKALAEAGANGVGANCGVGIEEYITVCRRLRAGAPENIPVWIKANAGLPEMVGGEIHYKMTAEGFADHAPRLVEAGATFIGGCCGTSPDFIRAICQKLGKS